MGLIAAALAFVVDVALGTWLGAMAFFSFVAAPRTFAVLDDRAGEVVSDVFPRYYSVGVALGTVALAAAILSGVRSGVDAATVTLLVLVLVALLFTGYARWVLIPRMDAAGDDGFVTYHRVSVVLNGATMLAVLLALAASHAP